ncbi:MAG: hypothetical protein KTR31_12280 [Myxococcales bacterium]|nr:hypothetical protein [Myxococcales bacterium]
MSQLLDRAEALARTVDVPPDTRDTALVHLAQWCEESRFEPYRAQIEALVDGDFAEELVDAFRRVLPFGTGGRRGHVGVGPNRLNPHTVGTSVQGHALWLRRRFRGQRLKVAIAYDVRRFTDVRGMYDRGRPSPFHGMSSRDLAEVAARTYAANGVSAVLLERDSDTYLSTPELSFTIRALGATGGLNVSASHNPPDDNGVKVYDERGAQLAAPHDESLLEVVGTVEQAVMVRWSEAVSSGLVTALDPAVREQYLREVASVVPAATRDLRCLYTPLHGAGIVDEALVLAGVSCALHEPQATRDGRFPTVPGAVANPENPAAMAHAVAAAGDAELVFGTDPDADRIGCEVRHGDSWVHLTGNDIAALVVHRACQRDLGGKRPLVILTEVTTSLASRVAEAAGAAVVDDLLVGFKHIAAVLETLETQGEVRGIRADEVAFVAAAEESHGVLVTDQIRDKDAAGGAVMLAALAAEAKEHGQTLVDVLRKLEQVHGTIRNQQRNFRFEGATGASQMAQLLRRIRQEPFEALADRPVLSFTDHLDETGRFGPYLSDSHRAARNVLVFELGAGEGALDDGARVVLRPSGTEPKLKIYVEVRGRPALDEAQRVEVDQRASALVEAVSLRLAPPP